MPRVFIPQKVDKYDVSKAEEYGELIPLLEDSLSPFNIMEMIYKFINAFRTFDFNPEKDFVCMTGNSLVLCWLSIALVLEFQKVKILIYDSRLENYYERTLERPILIGSKND
jgi:hypothetical protein